MYFICLPPLRSCFQSYDARERQDRQRPQLFLADSLTVPEPFAEVTHLADVVGVMKCEESNRPANLAVERWWTFRRFPCQEIRVWLTQSCGEFVGYLGPCSAHFIDRGIF